MDKSIDNQTIFYPWKGKWKIEIFYYCNLRAAFRVRDEVNLTLLFIKYNRYKMLVSNNL